MATYAIGDIQGCWTQLAQLVERLRFNPHSDQLWFVGDLVNRGPKSLQVLRFVKGLAERAVVVLGNHDLHLVSEHEGFDTAREGDTFDDVLGAPDRKELVDWLRTRPMMHVEGGWAMVHAGLLPQWSIQKGLLLGKEVERALRGASYREFLKHMYGSKPDQWSETLAGWDAPTQGKRRFEDLPKEARAYVARLEEITGVPAAIVSTGSGRDETILREGVLSPALAIK